MIKLKVARIFGGAYIGVTFSDRWNLESLKDLGRETGLKLDISECLTKGQLDRLRRTLKGLGFLLSVRSDAVPSFRMEPAETEAMGGPVRATIRRPSLRNIG